MVCCIAPIQLYMGSRTHPPVTLPHYYLPPLSCLCPVKSSFTSSKRQSDKYRVKPIRNEETITETAFSHLRASIRLTSSGFILFRTGGFCNQQVRTQVKIKCLFELEWIREVGLQICEVLLREWRCTRAHTIIAQDCQHTVILWKDVGLLVALITFVVEHKFQSPKNEEQIGFCVKIC